MREMTPGKQRGLDTLATDEGVFAILAIDHRDSLRAVLPDDMSDSQITEFKLDLIRGIGSRASGVMLEPEFTLPHALVTGTVPGATGFMAALEAQGYLGDPWSGPTEMLAGWSALDAKRMGASAAKLLLPYSPDRPAHAEEQRRVVVDTAALCAELDLALLVEPVAFGMAPADRREIVVQTVRELTGLGVDVLKLEFPGDPADPQSWSAACAAVTETATVPWVLLSSGVTFEEYEAQLTVAFSAGCSGYTGGRAIWRPATEVPAAVRDAVIEGEIVERFERLRALAISSARPWRAT